MIWTIIISVVSTVIVIFVIMAIIGNRDQKKQLKEGALQTENIVNNSTIESGDRYNVLLEQKEKLERSLKSSKDEIAALEDRIKLLSKENISDPEVLKKLSEVDSLKKKIKGLEDDCEELEDDLKSSKKKLKDKSDECSELSKSCTRLEKDLKQIQEEAQTLKDTLKKKEEEIGLKNESLQFVQEILSAKEFSTGNKIEKYRRIDSLKDFLTSELMDSMNTVGYPWNDDFHFQERLNRWESQAKKDWIAGKTAIAFIGEFSAGKTTIVNRILSQDDPSVTQLPTGMKATTAIPTYISGGVKTEFEFFSQDSKLKKLNESTFKRVNKEVLAEVGGISNLIRYFVMEYKNEKLNNISILDTPGFSSNDEEDSKRTIEVINECDALFWVFDVNAGTVNRSSLQLIKEHLQKPLYVIINQIDTKAKKEVDSVEATITKAFTAEGVAVEGILRFSKKEPLAILMEVIGKISTSSSQDQFLDEVYYSVENTLKKLQKNQNNVSKRYKDLRGNTDSINQQIRNLINSAQRDCNTAVNIPHFETHWFKKDNFEMSQAEYRQLESVLNRIDSQTMPQLRSLAENLNKSSKNEQSALEEKKSVEYHVQLMEDVLKKLRVKIGDYLSVDN